LENLAVRQQLAILNRSTNCPRLIQADRLFWVIMSRIFADWRQPLVIIKPQTVIAWHRKGFKLFWTWKAVTRPVDPAPIARSATSSGEWPTTT
jgi:putative transposase